MAKFSYHDYAADDIPTVPTSDASCKLSNDVRTETLADCSTKEILDFGIQLALEQIQKFMAKSADDNTSLSESSLKDETETTTQGRHEDSSHYGDDFTKHILARIPELNPRASSPIRSQRVPDKLYALLRHPDLANIITWMPHGRSWKVLQIEVFEKVPCTGRRNKSKARDDEKTYFHELFLRGKPHLHKRMQRLPTSHKKVHLERDETPDFDNMTPLPQDQVDRTVKHAQSKSTCIPNPESAGGLPVVEGKAVIPSLLSATSSRDAQRSSQIGTCIDGSSVGEVNGALHAAQTSRKRSFASLVTTQVADKTIQNKNVKLTNDSTEAMEPPLTTSSSTMIRTPYPSTYASPVHPVTLPGYPFAGYRYPVYHDLHAMTAAHVGSLHIPGQFCLGGFQNALFAPLLMSSEAVGIHQASAVSLQAPWHNGFGQ